MNLSPPRRTSGFTRADLLSALASVALLGVLALNLAGTTRAQSRAARCLANFKDQAGGWTSYATDNQTLLAVMNGSWAYDEIPSRNDYWVTGWQSWLPASDNTNRARLRSPAFATYLPGGLNSEGDFAVFRCPEDRYWSPDQIANGWPATGPGRVRSYSQNPAVGPGNVVAGPWDPKTYRQVTRLSEISNPAGIFFLTEEHPDFIDDPCLYPPLGGHWIELPASYHGRGAHFAFADGHVEHHRWRSPTTVVPVRYSYGLIVDPPSIDADQQWIKERTPRRQ